MEREISHKIVCTLEEKKMAVSSKGNKQRFTTRDLAQKYERERHLAPPASTE